MLLMIKFVYGSLFAKTAQVKKILMGMLSFVWKQMFQVKFSNGPRHICILASLYSPISSGSIIISISEYLYIFPKITKDAHILRTHFLLL